MTRIFIQIILLSAVRQTRHSRNQHSCARWRDTELTSIFSKYANIRFKESIQQTFYGLAGLRNKKKNYNKNKFTHAF